MRWIIEGREVRKPGFRVVLLRLIRIYDADAPGEALAAGSGVGAPGKIVDGTARRLDPPLPIEGTEAAPMAEPFRFRPAGAADGANDPPRRKPFLRTAFGRFLFALLLLVALAAAALGAWVASGREVPQQLRPANWSLPASLADISPQSLGVLFVGALVVFGALAAIILVVNALRRAFDPSYSAPYRTYILFTLVAAMISGYTTTYGVTIEFLDPTQGFVRYRIFPVVVFLYAFLFVYLTWSWTFDLVIRSEPRRRIAIALFIPLLAAIPIFAVSTTTSALGLAGPRILERRLLTWLDDYSESLSDLSAYIGETEAAALSLETFADRLDTLATQETETGAITGYAGSGAVVSQLTVAAEDLNAGADLIRREADERAVAIEAMAGDIDETRDEILSGAYFEDASGAALPVRDWQDKVQAQERQLRRQWEEISSRAYVRAAMGQLALLDSLILGGGISDSRTVAAAQRDGQARVSAYLATGQEVARAELAEAAAEDAPRPPGISYQSPLIVLFRNWQEAILPWVIAIAVDFGPWVWIALAAIAGYDRRRSRARYAQVEDAYWEDTPAPRAAPLHVVKDQEKRRLDQR